MVVYRRISPGSRRRARIAIGVFRDVGGIKQVIEI
jgi:hypothetical protein